MVALKHGRTIELTTPYGSVAATRVVLALNAWGVQLPGIGRFILPVASDMAATQPVSAELSRIGWRGGPAISVGDLQLKSFRQTKDHRVIFGVSSGAPSFGGRVSREVFASPSPRYRALQSSLIRHYPGLATAQTAQSWSAPLGCTRLGLPIYRFLDRHNRVFFVGGYTGLGLSPAFVSGKIVASTMLDARDEWRECGLVSQAHSEWPREPLRYIAAHAVRAAARRKDDLDRAGKPVDPLSRWLVARLPGRGQNKR
jgi:glycine/D-amino acid oxidase-like deaminating enzyme